MKIEKSKIEGCVKVISDLSQMPARATSVGGSAYSIGSTIELDAVVEMKPLPGSTSTRNWFGVSALVNGAVSVVGFNTLLGVHFDKDSKRQTIDNGVNDKPISELLGKTLKVVGTHEYTTLEFLTAEEREAGKEAREIARTMPVFEIVGAEAKAPKESKAKNK